MYENRKIQSFVKNYFNQHEYLKNKDPDQVTSILVYDYLIQNGYEKVAQKLAIDILKSQELSECESDESDEEVSKLIDPDRLTFTLVIDYLNKFGYSSKRLKIIKHPEEDYYYYFYIITYKLIVWGEKVVIKYCDTF